MSDLIFDLTYANNELLVDGDLYEYAQEQGFDVEATMDWEGFCEFWEIYEEWKEDVTK